MSAPRQRQAYDHGTRGDIRTMNDEPGSPIEHRAARRNRQVGRLGARRLMVLITAVGSICLLYLWLGAEAARFSWEEEDMWKPLWYPHLATCPNYRDYARSRHQPYTRGQYILPYQRPAEKCRTFRSEQVEKLITEVTKRIKDPDLARLFENCYPNTLDTTVRWHSPDKSNPQSFIITGDINAEWLRDSANQLAPYAHLLTKDKRLALLFRGAIATQAEYITTAPYCNAFQPPPDSHIPPLDEHGGDKVYPVYDPTEVFECKYELDSLASFLKLSWLYYEKTNRLDFVTGTWIKAVTSVLKVLEEQSLPTFDPASGLAYKPKYGFLRWTNAGTETLSIAGIGNPVNGNISLIRSAFRPSDDATILQFLIPSNAFMSVELGHLSEILRKGKYHSSEITEAIALLAEQAESYSKAIAEGIQQHAVLDHPIFGRVYAYEVDGYGGRIFMDDANVPSLLSLPLLGFVDRDDPIYLNTRRMILSREGNPYYLVGPQFKGIGGPHIGITHPWPMSVIVQIMTSDDNTEIMEALDMLKGTTGGLGLMHESVNVRRATDYTRPWFAWANGLFGEMILDIIDRKPELITHRKGV